MAPTPLPFSIVLTRVFLPFAAGYFLSYLYRSVNAVIGPDLTASLGLDAGALGLLTSAYFLAFASSQLPLGLLLDRFGPRRIEAALLMFAASGAIVFGMADGLGSVIVGRALIGFGVSACLMAAFKGNVLFFPPDKLPLVNGLILASGGLGALTATAPIEALLSVTDWRSVFYILGALTVAAAAAIFLLVPERPTGLPAGGLGRQISDTAQIYRSRMFWRVAPLPMISQAAFMAIQGLWAGPWLRDVAGLDRMTTAEHLFAAAAAMVAGFVLMGAIAERLNRVGIRPLTVAVIGMTVFLVNQCLVTTGWTGATMATWITFGFFGTSGTLCYAALAQSFPAHLAGRVNTALNLLVFIAAFGVQWSMGAIIDLWPRQLDGYPPAAYQAAFGTMVVLQAAALVWFVLPRRPALMAAGASVSRSRR